jgi:hypothetical protein
MQTLAKNFNYFLTCKVIHRPAGSTGFKNPQKTPGQRCEKGKKKAALMCCL